MLPPSHGAIGVVTGVDDDLGVGEAREVSGRKRVGAVVTREGGCSQEFKNGPTIDIGWFTTNGRALKIVFKGGVESAEGIVEDGVGAVGNLDARIRAACEIDIAVKNIRRRGLRIRRSLNRIKNETRSGDAKCHRCWCPIGDVPEESTRARREAGGVGMGSGTAGVVVKRDKLRPDRRGQS